MEKVHQLSDDLLKPFNTAEDQNGLPTLLPKRGLESFTPREVDSY